MSFQKKQPVPPPNKQVKREFDLTHERTRGYAYPELQAKLNILLRYEELLNASKHLRDNKELNNGRIVPQDLSRLKSAILAHFDEIRGMIVRQTPVKDMTFQNRTVFRMIIDLEYERRNFSYPDLLLMKDYLIDKTTNIGLINLLRTSEHYVEEFFE